MPSRRAQPGLFWAVAFPVWVFLGFLLAPTVTRGGDCGELIATSYRLGIAHPSGYPVWCLLGRLFAFLPWGEIGWRYNLFSSLCGALAAGFIALGAYRITWMLADAQTQSAHRPDNSKRETAPRPHGLMICSALGAGFLFAGAYSIGSQFLIAEVYAGAALVGAAVLYFSLAWHQDGDIRDLLTLALLGGLALVVHLSAIFILPWVIITALWKWSLSRAQIGWVLALGLVGFSPVLYLPLRSAQFPTPAATNLQAYFYAPLDWGHPASISALKNHITGAQYRNLLITTETRVEKGQTITTRRLTQPLSELPAHLSTLVLFTFLQFLWATPLLLVGAISLFRAEKRVFWLLLLIAVSNIAVEINYDVSDQLNFFFPAYLVMALWLGAGWFATLRAFARLGSLSAKVGPVLLFATVFCQWSLFGSNAKQGHATRHRDNALEQARAMQQLAAQTKRPVAGLFPADDLLWGFWYAKYVLGAARDVEAPWGRLVNTLNKQGKTVRYVEQLRARGPVCLSTWDSATDARFPLVMLSPAGNICVASSRRLPPPAQPLSAAQLGNADMPPHPNGLLGARFRRVALWRGRGELPALSPSGTAAFEVDFSVPARWKPTEQDQTYGRIEVLMTEAGQFAKALKQAQSSVSASKRDSEPSRAKIQKRRLILPAKARGNQLLRAAVPLDVEITGQAGTYEVWTRLVLPAGNRNPAWTRTDRVLLTQK